MTFQHTFQQASFRDVPFKVGAADTAVGRRVAVHEYPMRNQSGTEDLGKKDREFVVEGFLVGLNYRAERDALIAALEQPGPGTLIHPSFGSLSVVLVAQARLREQFIERRGTVTFALTFMEAGLLEQPAVEIDTQQAVEDAADACYGPIEEDFANNFSVDGAPSWSIDSITAELEAAADVLAEVRNGFGLDLSSLASLTNAAGLFRVNLAALLKAPGELATALVQQVKTLVEFFDFSASNEYSPFAAARRSVAPLKSMLGLGQYGKPGTSLARPAVPLTGTPYRVQQAANQEASFALIRRTALVEAARSVIFQPFNSFNEATEIRDLVYDALEEEILTAPDPVYRALSALRAAVVQDVTSRGANLVRISTLTLQESVPALVLSHRLYGTTAFADDLVNRNNLLNPLLVPGGVPLEVRSV